MRRDMEGGGNGGARVWREPTASELAGGGGEGGRRRREGADRGGGLGVLGQHWEDGVGANGYWVGRG